MKKDHICKHPGCNKSFTRAEHLRRHALNHEQPRGGFTCERCSVHFKRSDLLARHISRHDKRDEEAGGPGLGVLKTRKRTRRAHDGTIIVRPSQRELQSMRSAAQSSSNSSTSCSGLDLVGEEDYDEEGFPAQGGPISPPTSGTDFASLSLEEPDPLLAPMMPGGPFEPFMEPIPGQFDAADGSFSVGLGGMTDLLGLDTATDFNLPFAATCNYNWLFDVAYLDDAFHHFDFPLGSDTEACPDVQMDISYQPTGNYDGPSALLEVASMMQTGESSQRTPAPDASSGILEMEWMCGTSFLGQTQSPRLPQISEISRQARPPGRHSLPKNGPKRLLTKQTDHFYQFLKATLRLEPFLDHEI
ncbi:uncharacterized protein BHQ10_005908 [Talaromyces amestolkiae]|uniref:C2H2-type domain-containing protein n=1 Tax=Talaromyces amestolkiae TaxID=1196081 RepID=A0A364L275_TALAM|nr:uncharacterized protein BHQ10_005908 [Talaromyces amestolkiae]RAO69896.1 hypothetical protein BHQ10_005908 [Talaromyces amestolkiae]